jgi:hypothetical protein
MIKSFLLASALLAGVPGIALAQSAPPPYDTANPPPPVGSVVVASRTVMRALLETSLSSKTSQLYDQVVLDVLPPFPADDPRFRRARIFAHVGLVERAGGFRKGQIRIDYDRIVLADGTDAVLHGSTISVDQTTGGSRALRTVAGGAVGAVVGGLLGGAGALIGAAGGALAGSSIGTNVSIDRGSVVQLETTRNAVVTGRRQAPSTGQYNPGPSQYGNPQPYNGPGSTPPPGYPSEQQGQPQGPPPSYAQPPSQNGQQQGPPPSYAQPPDPNGQQQGPPPGPPPSYAQPPDPNAPPPQQQPPPQQPPN